MHSKLLMAAVLSLITATTASALFVVFSGTSAQLATYRLRIPEPSSISLLGCGALALCARKSKRRTHVT